VQIKQAHHEKGGCAARQWNAEFRAHQQWKTGFAGAKRHHDIE
jgi:hypothetical protein